MPRKDNLAPAKPMPRPRSRFSQLIEETAPATASDIAHVNAKLSGPMAELWNALVQDRPNASQVLREAIRVRAFLEDQMLLNLPVQTSMADGTHIPDLCALLQLQLSPLNEKIRKGQMIQAPHVAGNVPANVLAVSHASNAQINGAPPTDHLVGAGSPR